MGKALSIFQYDGRQVRSFISESGEPWFVAHDVSFILGYANSSKMMERIDEDERSTTVVVVGHSNGRQVNREMTIINESGLYSAILGSQKPNAKQFKKWVTSEVLPSIRKTGSYDLQRSPSFMIEDPIARARAWADEQEKVKLLIESEKKSTIIAELKGDISGMQLDSFEKESKKVIQSQELIIKKLSGKKTKQNHAYTRKKQYKFI